MKPLIEVKAKEAQIRKPSDFVRQNSDEQNIRTDSTVAELGMSGEQYRRAKIVVDQGDMARHGGRCPPARPQKKQRARNQNPGPYFFA